HFVRSHYRELRRKERAELIGTEEAASRRRLPKEERLEERLEHIRRYEARQRWIESRTPRRAAPAVGRNEPCPCGSGRKFKKCCGP
ncbi:MAG: SEC-C domain-containing protein, partial [Verrucomicrobiae bacterium]|nr:SEC-C domain-containing protein [Verrucomicrobiae bacterium]